MTQPIYLDVCVLSRPFDEQNQARIRLETGALQIILAHIRSGRIAMVVSPVHKAESASISDQEERSYLELLFQELGMVVEYDKVAVRQRAEALVSQGMGIGDAAHVAFAEAVHADFVSVDDRLLKQCNRLDIKIWHGSPLAYCDKEDLR